MFVTQHSRHLLPGLVQKRITRVPQQQTLVTARVNEIDAFCGQESRLTSLNDTAEPPLLAKRKCTASNVQTNDSNQGGHVSGISQGVGRLTWSAAPVDVHSGILQIIFKFLGELVTCRSRVLAGWDSLSSTTYAQASWHVNTYHLETPATASTTSRYLYQMYSTVGQRPPVQAAPSGSIVNNDTST